ncbi:flavin reductase family protein [Ensifer adhaerens]|uniref:flavin reductase family protein n=1 Tax=Ensifer adhaerens TaxID=106592 RepID=UPI001CBDD0B6|nr:flavin reductase family protein [Ensifer adhaerens]MBZ7926718.1 flavin reductase family protein [Ensifer adhaerens]UAX96957.1 flavin reductase family protein [Ensifer adhaerens]UAY03697.1 flavin reductase family protein [Ensifer adhaerens]UAY11681.1 flavin reductase family protein [Ensifer adhaerens]
MRQTPPLSVEIDAHADMAVSKPEFANTLSHLAATVCVASAGKGAESLGRTVTATFSLSANPPSIVVSIRADSPLAALIAAEQGFSLAMLAEGQDLIADAFAGKIEASKRYLIGVWADWPSGRPRLLGAAAALDCLLTASIEVGDHMLFVGTIVATETSTHADPLIWNRLRYQSLDRARSLPTQLSNGHATIVPSKPAA